MRFTKLIVAGIVQHARCASCAINYNGAMNLVGERIICANCHNQEVFA